MSSPERMELMERNISRLALLVQQLGEFELANLERHARWEQRMQEIDQRIRESDQRMQAIDEEIRRLSEQGVVHAEKIRAMFEVIVDIQTDIARIDAAS